MTVDQNTGPPLREGQGVVRKVLIGLMLICLNAFTVSAQSWMFARNGVEYVIELPSASWRVVSRIDVHEHVEFINGNDEADGYLHISKILVNSGTSPFDLFQSEEKWNLQRLPGYVICGDCKGLAFSGHLTGATFSYEYSNAGKVMAGRIYYLQLDKLTFYTLRFTVAQDKLLSLRGQMDFIARSFRLK
jgi:hypothetical protein